MALTQKKPESLTKSKKTKGGAPPVITIPGYKNAAAGNGFGQGSSGQKKKGGDTGFDDTLGQGKADGTFGTSTKTNPQDTTSTTNATGLSTVTMLVLGVIIIVVIILLYKFFKK